MALLGQGVTVAAMLTNDEIRRIMQQPELTDKEVDEFLSSLRAFLSQVLDAYFESEFDA